MTAPCPTCGRCPTCGGAQAAPSFVPWVAPQPMPVYPYQPPWNPSPYPMFTWTGTATTNPETLARFGSGLNAGNQALFGQQ